MSEIIVTGFATTPVKGMRIHEVDSIELSRSGARGDRAFYVIDDRGRMVNGTVVRNLQVVVPNYDPDTDELTLTFPNGSAVGGVDLPTLELLAAYRREIDSTEPLPFGIYGEVLEGGTVRIGDPVTVQTPVTASSR